MQVTGESIRKGLAAAVDNAQDAGYAAPVLEGFITAIRSGLQTLKPGTTTSQT